VFVENRGTETADDVRVSVELPKGWTSENTESYDFANGTVSFLVASLAPGDRKELTFDATGNMAGENLVRASIRHGESDHAAVSQSAMLLFQNDNRRVAETADPLIIR
jgi:uncharacterized membrane protein